MPRRLSPPVLLLVVGSAHAQQKGAAEIPPSETVDMIYVVLFGVIFVGMIVLFLWYVWWNERKREPEEKAPEDA